MRVFAAAGAAVLLGLAACSSPATAAREPRVWSEEWRVSGRPTVRVRTGDAKVVVHTRDGSDVSVRVRQMGEQRGWFVGDRDPDVRFSRRGNEIEIYARLSGVNAGFVISSLRLQVDLWVPRETDLTVRTGDGDVTLGPLDGRINVTTGDGDIEALGLSGDIAFTTGDGDIDAGELDGRVVLRTGDGDALIGGRFDALELRSGDGDLDVTARRGSELREPWSVESRDGRIELRVPAGLRATLDARTSDGPLTVDLPLTTEGRIRRHRLVGELNGGGPTLLLRSTDGGIRVSPID